MHHLHTERLAALSDEPATPEELTHLSSCEVCAAEARAFDSLLIMSGESHEAFGLPLTRWDNIAAALTESAPKEILHLPAPRRTNRAFLQIAASLLLLAGGAMLGRMSAGTLPLLSSIAPIVASVPSTNASSNLADADSMSFKSLEEARAAQSRSEMVYQQAAAYLASRDSVYPGESSPVAVRSHLAALDRMISTASEGLREAPHDPVINDAYLNSVSQREVTLRQMNTTLPASLRVNSF